MAEINEQLSVWAGLFGFGEVRTTAGILASVIEVVAFAVLTASDCSCPGGRHGQGASQGRDSGRPGARCSAVGRHGFVPFMTLAIGPMRNHTPPTP
jgi:hypothetical protein